MNNEEIVEYSKTLIEAAMICNNFFKLDRETKLKVLECLSELKETLEKCVKILEIDKNARKKS